MLYSTTRGAQRLIWSALLIGAGALPTAAHHPLGGAQPVTFWHGLLSGFGHPVLGLDHLAFIAAVGIASAFLRLGNRAPAIFIGATLVGCLAVLSAGPMADLEMLVAASVLLIGLLVMSGRQVASPAYLALFAVAGLVHGSAYAGAMIGAEATPIAAYLIGLGLVQFALAAAMGFVTLRVWNAASTAALQPRLAGAVVAGVGLTFLLEHLEKLAFGAV